MGIKGTISPSMFKGNSTYSATFHHPLLAKRITRGLGTSDEMVARRICEGLQFLCAHPSIKKDDFIGHHPEAWKIFFRDVPGKSEPINARLQKANAIFPDMTETDKLLALHFATLPSGDSNELFYFLPEIAALLRILETLKAPLVAYDTLRTLLNRVGKRLELLAFNCNGIEAKPGSVDLVLKDLQQEVGNLNIPEDTKEELFLRLLTDRITEAPKARKRKTKRGKGAAAK